MSHKGQRPTSRASERFVRPALSSGHGGSARTCSASGQSQSHSSQPYTTFGGADEQRRGQGEVQRLGRFEIDHRLNVARKLYRQIAERRQAAPTGKMPVEIDRDSLSPTSSISAAMPSASVGTRSSIRKRVVRQEQIQMITSAIGRPILNAPPMIIANAESKFPSARTVLPAIPLLHRAPTGIARRPMMNDQKSRPTRSLTFSNRDLARTAMARG
jgi:hypothetical protein